MAQLTFSDFEQKPDTRPNLIRMHVIDAGEVNGLNSALFECIKCEHQTGWIGIKSVSTAKKGLPCPLCNFNAKILHLNLKREWFSDIKNGKKQLEYRKQTEFWKKRIENKIYDFIYIKLGYPKKDELKKVMIFSCEGYEKAVIKHKEFGGSKVSVYAILLNTRLY